MEPSILAVSTDREYQRKVFLTMDTYAFKALGQRPNEQLQCFAELLQSENKKHNLTRITETSQIYLRHFADSLQLTSLLEAAVAQAESAESRVQLMDMGSGAGLPGLALANQLYLALKAQGHGRDGTQALLLALAGLSDIDWKSLFGAFWR